MDTSETYIKMCEKAEEVQGLFEQQDFLVEQLNKSFITLNGTWLPRQDQLQEMLEYTWTGDLIRSFHIWGKERGYQTKAIASMEQLWLAFVMKEKHNKVWDGEWRVDE